MSSGTGAVLIEAPRQRDGRTSDCGASPWLAKKGLRRSSGLDEVAGNVVPMLRTMRALLSIVLVAAAAHAEDATVLPCRPTIACTAQIEVPGLLTVEAGYLLLKLDNPGSQQSAPFLIKLSANDWLQWQLGSNGPTFAGGSAPEPFFDDVTL